MLLDIWKWLGNNATEIVAICALVFTAYQAYLSRRHNRLSVLPRLATFSARNSEANIGQLDIKLSNNGLGPAIIKSYLIELDGDPQEFKEPKDALVFIQELVGIIGIKNTVTSLLPEHIIAAGETIKIMHLSFMEDKGKGWEHIERLMDRLSLRITYSSIYGEQFEYHSIETHS